MNERSINRRDFLAAAALAAAAGPPPRLWASGPGPDRGQTARVIQVTSDHIVRRRRVHGTILGEMLDLTLRRVTGTDSSAAAWRSILKSDDLIGLKFNRSAAEGLGIREPFADAVITSLLAAGFAPDQIVAIETSDDIFRKHGVVQPANGWHDKPTEFGSGRDLLAALLDQVTAIINIPFLKTHNIAGITCCLKNLSHALIKHPARFHRNGCAPFIGDIVALPAIRDKLRLHLVNALRIVFDQGPEASDRYTWDAGIMLAGMDPIAMDTAGLQIINSQRKILSLPEIDLRTQAVYLEAAAKRGLGVQNRRWIETVKLRI
ncbi:MAG: DUF362 domain-containing protein [Phycisphaerae bacterium]